MKILGTETFSASAPEHGENDEYSFPTSKGSGDGSE
jgi:hypothetical protein